LLQFIAEGGKRQLTEGAEARPGRAIRDAPDRTAWPAIRRKSEGAATRTMPGSLVQPGM
jgi:hypothetical protein